MLLLNHCNPMSLRPLHPELEKKALEELEEDPQKLKDGIQHIKDWLTTQPHLHANTNDQWVASYIRGCGFDLEKVKQKLDLFYTCRVTAPELFQVKHNSDKFRELFSKGFYLPLPKLEGPAALRVCLIRPRLIELVKENILEALSVVQIIHKVMIVDDDNSMIVGNITVMDYKDMNVLDMYRLSALNLKKVKACQQDATPFSTFISIGVNASPDFVLVINMAKALLDDNENIHVFSENYEEMYEQKIVPREVMPAEYGGSGGTIEEIINHWMEKFQQYDEWLNDDEQYGTDESKRAGKPKTYEDMFGEESLQNIAETIKYFLSASET